MAGRVGVVASLHRYPVKSMRGEPLAALDLDRRGVVGDRMFAVQDGAGRLGSGKNTRRFRAVEGLIHCAARYDGDVPEVRMPDGSVVRASDPAVHDVLSRWLGLDVRLVRESAVSHLDAAPVHLITTASLARVRTAHPHARVDERRFRPNLLVRTDPTTPPGFVEDTWVGRTLRVGAARLEVTEATERCVMVNAAQDDLDAAPGLLRSLADVNDLCLGVYARVVNPARISRGDAVVVE
jgi:uncharacterized protein